MKLLVVSHACITPLNQSFYAEVERLTGWDVSLVVPARWDTEYQSGLTLERWPGFKGQIHAIPVWKSGNIPLHVYKQSLIGLLRRERPDVIYVNHEPYGLATAQVYLANRLAGNAPIGCYGSQNILKTYPIPFRWMERWVLKRSDFCITLNEGALEVLRHKGYRGGAAQVLPMPLDTDVYFPRPEWAADQRAALGIGADEFVIGYLGRLVEEKGLKTALLAVRALSGIRWRYVLVGNGPYENILRATVMELGLQDHVIFVGYVPHTEAPGWLSLFDVLVLASESRPNWKEQFGRVLIEASACETAVIGTESGEIGNVLRSTNGGLIVPENDPDQLGKAMLQLATNPQLTLQLAQQGAAATREKYGMTYLASLFADVIRKVHESNQQ